MKLVNALAVLSLTTLSRRTPFVMSDPDVCSIPWWERENEDQWDDIDPDFNWNSRRTGVTPEWSQALALWKHYNATSLDAHCRNHDTPPEPWSVGRMTKFLRLLNENEFELRSVYEEEAQGKWMAGAMKGRPDGLLEHGHVFKRTPYRVIHLPFGINLPVDVLQEKIADTSQVTIVQPDGATFSGPRWLPSAELLSRLRIESEKYSRVQFCEMWLAEPVLGVPEGRKIGLFCQYDGMTGDLIQVFRINEVLLHPVSTAKSPDSPISLQQLEVKLEANPAWPPQGATASLPISATLASGKSVQSIVQEGSFKLLHGRVVQLTGPLGNERALVRKNLAVDFRHLVRNPDDYWDCRFDDGVYALIPKSMSADLEHVHFELGAITLSGDIHRLVAFGRRSNKSIDTTLYERWHPTN